MLLTNLKNRKIVCLLSGSISCYKVCGVISTLIKEGASVQCVTTQAALQFIGSATLEGLTGKPVLSSPFSEGQMMSHIHLLNECDLLLVAPATANTINKFVQGIGDDLVSTLFLAYDFSFPCLLAPAMNGNMYRHPATQRSVGQLREWGVKFVGPEEGNLACGATDIGRLASEQNILTAISEVLK